MRNIVRDVTHALHQLLDSIEHRVELLAQFVEFVTAAAIGYAPREIAIHDFAAGFVDRLDAAVDAPAHKQSSEETQRYAQTESPDQSAPDHCLGANEVANVAPHQQMQTVT